MKAGYLQMKESITVAGIIWSKFAEDSEGNAYMLADGNLCLMKFGKDNDWRKSLIREKLNTEVYWEIEKELGAGSLVLIETDLFSHDGLRDYGKCEDMVSLLTYDLYRNNRENIKENDGSYWTCTPNSTPSGVSDSFVRYIDSDGCVNCDCGDCNWIARGVRPFFILKRRVKYNEKLFRRIVQKIWPFYRTVR